ncbi:MAG: hypothetical protein LC792_00555, partial [Actinobacteria bacterium]|nr:hypothetical protein [Actinomycetota bacterium]
PLVEYPRVPMRYARCLADRAISATWSTTVPKDRLGVDVDELPGGHMVGCAHPDALVEYLLAPSPAVSVAAEAGRR